MNSILNTLGYSCVNEYNNKITTTLSTYIEKIVSNNGSVDYEEINTTYFLENDKWNIEFFKNIPQFKEQVDNYKYSNKNITFSFTKKNINKELKFLVYNKLFSDEWSLQTVFLLQTYHIKKLAQFINQKYPKLDSVLYMNKANFQWID